MLIHFLPQKKSSVGQNSRKCIFCSLFARSHHKLHFTTGVTFVDWSTSATSKKKINYRGELQKLVLLDY